jgi:hypothetical protein
VKVPVGLVLLGAVGVLAAACGSASAAGPLSAPTVQTTVSRSAAVDSTHAVSSSQSPVARVHSMAPTSSPVQSVQPTELSDTSSSTLGDITVTVRNCRIETTPFPGYGTVKLFAADLTIGNSSGAPVYTPDVYHIMIGSEASDGLMHGSLGITIDPGSMMLPIDDGPDPVASGATAVLRTQPDGPVACAILLFPGGY